MNIVNLPSKVDNLRGDRGSGLAHTFHHVETTIANLRKKSPSFKKLKLYIFLQKIYDICTSVGQTSMT